MNEHFPGKKRRSASVLLPPNALKRKTGSGRIDARAVKLGQLAIEENAIDISQLVEDMLKLIDKGVKSARNGSIRGEAAVNELIYPVAQLKAHGDLFHYPAVTKASHIILDFLETVPDVDNDVLDVLTGFCLSIQTISRDQTSTSKESKDICAGLLDACNRYHKKKDGTKEER